MHFGQQPTVLEGGDRRLKRLEDEWTDLQCAMKTYKNVVNLNSALFLLLRKTQTHLQYIKHHFRFC